MKSKSGQTAVELVFLFILFLAGFIPGHYVAMKKGLIPGAISGFFICWGGSLHLFTCSKFLSDKVTMDIHEWRFLGRFTEEGPAGGGLG